jgi:DNA-binding transcriptional MocR family regulator
LTSLCKALVGKNTVVLAEDPSYSVALHCFQRAGARVVTVPLLADGPDMDAALLWKRLRLQGVKLMPGTVFILTGSAQHFLRLSYVGCPLEQIPEGVHCIDWEIDWLLEHQAVSEI